MVCCVSFLGIPVKCDTSRQVFTSYLGGFSLRKTLPVVDLEANETKYGDLRLCPHLDAGAFKCVGPLRLLHAARIGGAANRVRSGALVKCPMMISELGHTTHSRHVENPYLGFLFRCYSDPSTKKMEGQTTGRSCCVDTLVEHDEIDPLSVEGLGDILEVEH